MPRCFSYRLALQQLKALIKYPDQLFQNLSLIFKIKYLALPSLKGGILELRFKKKFEKTGVLRELRSRQAFEKKSITRRHEIKHAIYKQNMNLEATV